MDPRRINPFAAGAPRLCCAAPRHPTAPAARPSSRRRRTPRVLILDDNPDLRDVLDELLRDGGCLVQQAGDSAEAFVRLQTDPCDVVLLDVELKGENGLDLLPQLRRRYPNLRVIMFTGLGHNPQLTRAALEGGASGFLSKDDDPDLLLRVIRQNAAVHP